MKLNISILSILSILAAGVLFSSCEPRDSKITRPDTRVNPTGGPAGQTDGKADNYKYMAVLADRQVEAIELFRAVTDEQFAAAKKILLEDVEVDGIKYKKISAKVSNLKSEKLETTRDSALLVQLVVDANGKLQQIVAKESQAQLTYEKAVKLAGNTDISVKNKLKSLVIANLGNESWHVSLTSSDEINLKIGKSIMMNVLKFVFTPDAISEVFSIRNVEMVHMRSGALVGDFSLKSDAATTMAVTMKTAEQCSSVSGVLHLNSFETKKNKDNSLSPLYDRTLTYNNSDVVIQAGKDTIPLKATECENRLSVDLGKLLN
jgi:hypothetical protein